MPLTYANVLCQRSCLGTLRVSRLDLHRQRLAAHARGHLERLTKRLRSRQGEPARAVHPALCVEHHALIAFALPHVRFQQAQGVSGRTQRARPHHRRHRPDTTASATPPAMTGLTQRGSQAPIGVTSAASSAASTQRLLHMQKQLPATRRQHSPIRARAELLHYLQFRQQIVRPQRHQSALQTV